MNSTICIPTGTNLLAWGFFSLALSVRFITYSYCRINLKWPKSVMEFIAQ